MQSKLFRITINSAQPALLLRFYEVLGFRFKQKSVDKGSQLWQGTLNGMNLDVISITEVFSNKVPSVQLSFFVESIEVKVKSLREQGIQVIVDPMPLGNEIMAVVIDPDGRSVELVQQL